MDLEELAQECVEEIEEDYIENSEVSTYSDYSGECQAPGVYIDYIDTPDLEDLTKEYVEQYIEDNNLNDEQQVEFEDFVSENLSSEDDLEERIIDRKCDND